MKVLKIIYNEYKILYEIAIFIINLQLHIKKIVYKQPCKRV